MNTVVEREALAKKLLELRETLNLSQAQLCKKIGADADPMVVSRWERGEVPKHLFTFARMALALGHTPDSLLLVDSSGIPGDSQFTDAEEVQDIVAIVVALKRANNRPHAAGQRPSTLIRLYAEALENQK